MSLVLRRRTFASAGDKHSACLRDAAVRRAQCCDIPRDKCLVIITMNRTPVSYDCAVIGAGPAGLTAAIYLARYHRHAIVFNGGVSRAQWIPESHNCPGFPGGIAGTVLLEKLHAQLACYDTHVRDQRVVDLKTQAQGFALVDAEGLRFVASKVLIATGIVDVLPEVDWIESAIRVGAVRLCAVCDGYEVTDKRIAVYGPSSSTLDHAIFLRTYSPHITLVCSDERPLDHVQREHAAEAGIRIIERTEGLRFDGHRCSFVSSDGLEHPFDSVYPFLGCCAQSKLAVDIGAATDKNGELRVTPDQMSSVAGLYVAGDVVSALNQISVAVGHGGIAATAIHGALPRNFR